MNCVGYSKLVPWINGMNAVPVEEQKDRILEYAATHDLKVSGFYTDRRKDANVDTAFQKLRKDGMDRKFDLVIIDSLYRFGVGMIIARDILNSFYLMGIHFIILEDGIDSRNETGKSLKEYFILKNNQSKGHYMLFSEQIGMDEVCRANFKRFRYGYLQDPDTGKLVIDKEAAKVIRMIFELVDQGFSKATIVDILNDRAIPSPQVHLRNRTSDTRWRSDGVWKLSAIYRICLDRRYLGITDKNGAEFPRIIDNEVFEKANPDTPMTMHREPDPLACAVKHKMTDKLVLRKSRDGIKYFCINDCQLVSLDLVLAYICQAITEEREESIYVCKCLGYMKGKCIALMDKTQYELEARRLLEEMIEIKKEIFPMFSKFVFEQITEEEYSEFLNDVQSRLQRMNMIFSNKTLTFRRRKELFCPENPWIVKYKSFRDVTPDSIEKYVKEITISEDGQITIVLDCEGKDVFPEEWLRRA